MGGKTPTINFKTGPYTLKHARSNYKLSQEKFAEQIGCSREYISRLENNKEKMSLGMMLNISEIYDVTPEFFFKN